VSQGRKPSGDTPRGIEAVASANDVIRRRRDLGIIFGGFRYGIGTVPSSKVGGWW
jgi:hypothetical protein